MGIVADFEEQLFRRSPKQYACWHQVDLHNHSPSSHDYLGNKETAMADSIRQLQQTDVSVVMFTDHEKLPDRSFAEGVAKGSKRLILRGTELNIFVDAWDKPEGKVDKSLFFHLLVGFDPEGKESPEYWLADIYRRCNKQVRDTGSVKITGVAASIEDICKLLDEANAIAIPAHLHSTRDAFRSRSFDDIMSNPEFLRHARVRFSALEVTDLKTAKFFDGKHPETGTLRKSCIRSSDSHAAELLGSRVAYVQMELPSFQELKAGLELPSRTSLEAPPSPESYICGINIQGKFFPDMWLSLSPNCNALIGVKGSGKTSVLECLRFALGAPVPSSRQESVTSHLQSILGEAGTVRVLIKRADGAKLLVERAMNSDAYKVTFEESDRQEIFTNPEGFGFPAYILGWHEIEQAATDPDIRQVYLDTIAGREHIRQIQERAETAVKRIQYLHSDLSNRYSTFRALHEQIVRLEELRRGLQELRDGKLVELRDRYESAVSHMDAMTDLRRSVGEMLELLQSRASGLSVGVERAAFEGDSPLSRFLSATYGWVQGLDDHLNEFTTARSEKLLALVAHLDSIQPSMHAAFDEFGERYKEAVGKLTDEQRNLLESHRRVMEDTKALPRLRLEQETQTREIDAGLIELARLCELVAKYLDEKTKLREDKVGEMNVRLEPFGVRLAVEPLARISRLEDLNSKYSAGAKIYSELTSLATQEKRHHRRLARAYETLRNNLIDGYHLFFETAEYGYYVDFFEDDDLKIAFRAEKSGEEFSPIDQLSAGQRCTAVFPLLLKLREGPLIVDQPEDNLDNRHIADVIAPALSEDKQGRQIAFTSHNANLVVLTDAEHIAMFEATGSKGRVEARGFLCTSQSTITRHVIAILDGGEKALQLRYRKYGSTLPPL